MSRFFIDHPVFAWVIAIVLMLFGAIALAQLPVAQFPAIAPPAISISVTYPGASAETVQSTVVQVIEQQLSGLDHLLYFSSISNKDGSVTITLSFDQGTNADIAQVQVQNKFQEAEPRLPLAVQQLGVTITKATKNFLMIAGLVSTDGQLSSNDLSDVMVAQVQDAISRTAGVGDYQLFGSEYAMRIWLDPVKLDNFALTPVDVTTAISAQNVQVAVGELGGLPARVGQQLDATIIGPSYLKTPEAFGNILLKVLTSGAAVRVRDVGRVELGAESYASSNKYNGKPAAAMAIKLASGANALEAVSAVKKTMSTITPNLPPGVEVIYPYDTSPFVKLSITGVAWTLAIAIVLVFLILYLFLQSFRATLIPTIAVPVVLLGTCGVLYIAGYSINSLTMFAMVLAIGLLVDDAIVVVENVERVMRDNKLDPKEATRQSMDQITGALVGIAMVLAAVFLPMAFFSGSAGVIYRQFSITIVVAMLLSVGVALIFTPALCGSLLLAPKEGAAPRGGFFGWFNRGFDRTGKGYTRGVTGMLKRPVIVFITLLILVGVLGFLYLRLPTGFLPDEDQGVIFIQVTAPPGGTRGTTQAVLDDIRQFLVTSEAANVDSVLEVAGFSFGGQGQSSGLVFVRLKDWSDRSGSANQVGAIVRRAMGHFAGISQAQVFAFAPPAALELGNATGFDFELMDRGNKGHDALMAARNQLLGAAAGDKALSLVRPNGLDDEPQYQINIDRAKASALGLSITDVDGTMATAWGSAYVGDFIDRGRVKRVYVQGDIGTRMVPADLDDWFVRNSSGTMTPLSAFSTGTWITGSPRLERYNGISSVEILGSPALGQSSGTAIAAIEALATKLPAGFDSSLTGLSYEEEQSGSQTIYLYILAFTVVFLSLSALYESWAIPLAVVLVIPLGVIGVVAGTLIRGLENDVYFQVGMLTTIGLASKNAILIVEFAAAAYDGGKSLPEAALIAADERLRPILMTSLAFMLGVLPLAVSSGAGSGGQNAIGTAVVGGMLSATVLAIFFVPVFFVSVLGLFKIKQRPPPTRESPKEPAKEPAPT